MLKNNFNLTVNNFLTQEECDTIIAKYDSLSTLGEDSHLNYEKYECVLGQRVKYVKKKPSS